MEDLALITEHDLPELRDPNPKDRASAHKLQLHLIPPAAEILDAVWTSPRFVGKPSVGGVGEERAWAAGFLDIDDSSLAPTD